MIVSLVWKINRDDQNISTYERTDDDKKSLINYLIDVASKSAQKIKRQFTENVEISIEVPTSNGVELCGDTWIMFGIKIIDKVNGTSTKEYKTIPLSPRSSMNDLYEFIKEEVERIFSNIYKQLKNSQKMWDTVAIDNSDSEFLDKSISKMYSPSSKREVTFIEKLPMWSRRYIKNISFGRKPSYKYWIQLYKRLTDPEDSEYVIIVSDDIDDIINKLNRYKSGEIPKEKPWFSKDTKNIIFL